MVERKRMQVTVVDSFFYPQQTRDENNNIIPANVNVLTFRDFIIATWVSFDNPSDTERRRVHIALVEEEERQGYEVRLETYKKST